MDEIPQVAWVILLGFQAYRLFEGTLFERLFGPYVFEDAGGEHAEPSDSYRSFSFPVTDVDQN